MLLLNLYGVSVCCDEKVLEIDGDVAITTTLQYDVLTDEEIKISTFSSSKLFPSNPDCILMDRSLTLKCDS